MGLTFEPLGKYVRLVDERNTDMVTESVLGINIDKYFMPSVANVIGTDLSNYKLLRKGRFACNPMHVGRDGRLPVSRYTEDVPAIVSPAYFMFEIIDENEIESEYLMLCFRRPDFDRMCWFRTDASVRGGITWEDVCALTIPVPPISEQRKIVHDYQVITDRIELLRKMNENLENQGIALLQDKVANSDRVLSVDDVVILFDSMRKPVSGADRVNLAKIYPYYGAAALMDYIDEYIFDGIYGLIAEDGSVMDDDGHPTMQYVWGKFWVNNHAHIFQGKNGFSTETVYLLLKTAVIRDIVTGAVQLKVNQENLRSFKIAVPEEEHMDDIESTIQPLFSLIRTNANEIERLSKLADLQLATISKGA